MTPHGFIYLTTNRVTGKRYIGQSTLRTDNYLGSGKALKRAIKKYGIHNFSRAILFEAFSQSDLNWAEHEFIREYDAVKRRDFYNIAPGGRASLGFTGKHHTLEHRQYMSQKLKGHTVTDKVRAAVSITGKTHAVKNLCVSATCPHCGLSGKKGNMVRWHFNNCKLSPQKEL
jgi:group I intron endonuclease